MLTSQRIAVDLSEQRTKIREFPQDGDVEELGRLEAAHKATEIRYRVEARSEGVEEDAVETAITDTETVEVRQLLDKFSIGDVFNAVANAQPTQGVERELQQHLGLGVHSIPFDALIEKRAALTTTGDEPSGSGDIIAQLFPDSISAFAGVRGETVPAGERTYPVVSTGATVHRPAKSAAAGESTAALTISTLAPQRIQASVAYTIEDAAVFGPGLDAALRVNLRDALEDDFDKYVLLKASAGLLTFGSAPNNPSAASTGEEYLSAVYAGVDGSNASAVAQVRLIVGSTIYAHMCIGSAYRSRR